MTHRMTGRERAKQSAGDMQAGHEGSGSCVGVRREDGVYEMPGQHLHDGLICLPQFLPPQLDRIRYDLQLNSGDVVSTGFMKTGTTWLNNILFLVCNNADVDLSEKVPPVEILPFLEFNGPDDPLVVDTLETMTTGRLIKSHLPVRYFRRNLDKWDQAPKTVVCTRNPKDTLVSLYHFYTIYRGCGFFDGDWDEFFELFRQRALIYEDLFKYTASWWQMREHPRVHFVKYENLIKDAAGEVRQLANFLGRPLADDQIRAIVRATSFDHLKSRMGEHKGFVGQDDPDKNFFRKGVVGGWRQYFSQEQNDYVDQLCQQMYEPIGLKYEY